MPKFLKQLSYHFARDPDIWGFVLNQISVSSKVFAVLGCLSTGEMGKYS